MNVSIRFGLNREYVNFKQEYASLDVVLKLANLNNEVEDTNTSSNLRHLSIVSLTILIVYSVKHIEL